MALLETRQAPIEDALSAAPLPFRRNEFLTYILETRVPGVHFDVDDDAGLTKSSVSPLMLKSGRPCIVDGAREDDMVAGHPQNRERRDAAMKILDEQGSKGTPVPVSEEEKFTGDVVLDGIFHYQCLQFLSRKGPNFWMKNLKDRETICSVLLTMADNVKVLPPADEPLPTDLLNMTLWKASLWKLVLEMKTVEENFPLLIGNYGVYVLTSSPYAAFLRALAAEIADVRS